MQRTHLNNGRIAKQALKEAAHYTKKDFKRLLLVIVFSWGTVFYIYPAIWDLITRN